MCSCDMTRDSVYVYVCKSVKYKVCFTDSKSTQIAKSILAYVMYLFITVIYSTLHLTVYSVRGRKPPPVREFE